MKIHWKISRFEDLSLVDLYNIMYLRQLVFVVEQNAAYLDADKKDYKSIHVLGFVNEQLAVYARLLPQGVSYTEASIGRVVSHPEFRRQKLGYALMDTCIEVFEKEFNTSDCRISAQSYLVPFYTSYGFEICSEEYLEDGLPHFEMIRRKKP